MASRIIILAALMAVSQAQAEKPAAYVYGPPPDWSEYKQIGEAAVRAKLPSTGSWSIEWPNGYVPMGWFHRGRVFGYMMCGAVRSNGPVDHGYASYPFAIVIDNGAVKTIDIQPSPANSVVNVMCAAIVRQGRLPPASMMPQSQSIVIESLGLTIRPMAEGAYVTKVDMNSTAAASGIVAGVVMARANGVSLAGMGAAMVKLLDAKAPVLTMESVSGQHYQIERAP